MPFTENECQHLSDQFREWDQVSASPLYAALSGHIAETPEILGLMDELPQQKLRPVTLFAAVHFLVLSTRPLPLTAFYEEPIARDPQEAWPAFSQLCCENASELRRIMAERSVQTNEVNRCIALLPALMEVSRHTDRTLGLVELGASAGLNLLFDLYHYEYGGQSVGSAHAGVRLATEVRGPSPKLETLPPPVTSRAGIDLAPIDIHQDDEVRWLQACIWPGDDTRKTRLSAAIELARHRTPKVHLGDAASLLPEVVKGIDPRDELCLFNSWMLGWMEVGERQRLADVIHGIAATRPLWWITFESPGKVPGAPDPDPSVTGKDASLLALQHLGAERADSRVLAVMQHHGAWLHWLDPSST